MNDEMISDIADRQGWTNVTLLGLLVNFIFENDLNDRVVDYLRDIAFKENNVE